MKRRGDIVSELQTGDILTSLDYYALFLQPFQNAFVYVVQQDATGTIAVLFPDPQWTPQTNPVPAGQTVWVPKDMEHWFYLDTHVGQELIYIVATRERNAWLEALLQSSTAGGAAGALTAWLLSSDRGPGGVRRLESTSWCCGGKASCWRPNRGLRRC